MLESRAREQHPDWWRILHRRQATVRRRVESQQILIIGAGPCGLGCARELDRLGHRDWLILERSDHAGGLASSVVDPAGFTWDLGGHVVFSHFNAFDELLEEAMGEEILSHDRSSYVRFGDRWVPYPFQNNLRHLPEPLIEECLDGLAAAGSGNSEMDFGTWMRATFGDGITRLFMEPYNRKVWATPPDWMASHWIAERVSVIDYERALRSVRDGQDDVGWGPNNRFVFPAVGGTGEIYRRLAERFADRIRYGQKAVEVDLDRQTVRVAGGEELGYDALVSTMPLDLLCRALAGAPDELGAAASALRHNGAWMVGVGYETPLADDKSWMYFPQDHAPFYRATNFAKYSPENVPGGDVSRYCSYMTETSYSPEKPEPRDGLERRVEGGLRAAGVVAGTPPVVSVHVEDIPYAYPVPTLERDAALSVIQPWLEQRDVLSRGRFGSWCYEIGNMDHAVKMGIDAARRLVLDEPEELIATAGEAQRALRSSAQIEPAILAE
jgi:protoporphyrinogen oxidase